LRSLRLPAHRAAGTLRVKPPVGVFAGRLSTWLRTRPDVIKGIHRCSGGILVTLGLRLAFERR
jgi:threonine/homoserine/homoserine lactone efflux protein